MVDGTLVVGNDGVVCPVVCICRFVAVQVRAITWATTQRGCVFGFSKALAVTTGWVIELDVKSSSSESAWGRQN